MIPAAIVALVGLVLMFFGIAATCVEVFLRKGLAQTALPRNGIVVTAIGTILVFGAGLSQLLGAFAT